MPNGPGALILRADAGAQIGSGHVMRCLALGQAWQDLGGDVIFAACELPQHLASRLEQEQFRVERLPAEFGSTADADLTGRLAQSEGTGTVVVDGYHFTDEFNRQLQQAGCRVTVVDDMGRPTPADVILNHNLYASGSDYHGLLDHTSILVGCRFALLRREFRTHCTSVPPGTNVTKILVTCGGSDPSQATEKILTSLHHLAGAKIEVVAVAGSTNNRIAELRSLAENSPLDIRIEHDCRDMATLIRWADIAVAAAGSTCWEMACLGLPVIAVITAENQVRVAHSIEENGLGWNAEWINQDASSNITRIINRVKNDPSLLINASHNGPRLIDGQGALRVAQALADPSFALRLASEEDGRTLWEWRNDDTVREASFSTAPIAWETHTEWLKSCLQRPECHILIAENTAGHAIGQVRLDISGQRAVISISIAREFRACGYGTALIRSATNRAFSCEDVRYVDAFIREENKASQAAFMRAEYHQHADTEATDKGLRFVAHNPQPQRQAAWV